jgi:hypothetical protein
MNKREHETIIALQEAYANIYNEIVKPDRVFVATQYFRKKWVPLLGPGLAWVIVALRQHCYWSRETGEKRDWCIISQEELAEEVGISLATLKRLFKHPYAGRFIMDVSKRYRYDKTKRKQVRKNSRYRIRMDDPLVPEDEKRLKKLLTEKLSGLDIDPETGQMDFLSLLDDLAETSMADLQLKISRRSTEPADGQDQLEQSTEALAERLSKLLTGAAKATEISGTAAPSGNGSDPVDEPAYPDAVYVSDDDLPHFALAEDRVLIRWDNGYLAVSIAEVVKGDVRRCQGRPSEQTRTECFYSIPDALGEAPQQWLPEEQARIAQMQRLEDEMSQQYQALGAFCLEEALRHYFSSQLAEQFLTAAQTPAERQRLEAWISYTRQAKSLKNPSGFLRNRLESGEQPPLTPTAQIEL